ncbi:MAG: GPR endopeptidase [Clostridia bacterium]|nr:GPR endopeptidase [Clostridia bacterium]
MDFRTDLAIEKSEAFGQSMPEGVTCEVEQAQDVRITRICVQTASGAEALGKPQGRYITAEVPPFKRSAEIPQQTADAIARELRALLPAEGTVLVAGLGNSEITPDALGPKFSSLVLATRHIRRELAESAGLGTLRPVVNLTPGVLGKTGIETGELLRGVVESVRPAAVLTVDALAARRLARLGCTVQMADTGVTPGAGVGNARAELNRDSLGVPVIALGVPTVVDAATLVQDLTQSPPGEVFAREGADMMITPREIDLVIERAARLLALAVNRALQPHLSASDILLLVS